MEKVTLPILLAASFTLSPPVYAETNFGKIVTGVAESLISHEADRNAYLAAERIGTARAYRDYLAKFPDGAYRVSAEQALIKLDEAVEADKPPPPSASNRSAAAVEASIGLSRTQRTQIQKQLASIGYSPGVADGLWGTKTRNAVSRWQQANDLSATGYVTAEQGKMIARQAGPGINSDPGGSVNSDDPIEERLLSLTYRERRDVQRQLTSMGYNTRGVDGNFGPNTRSTLSEWQSDEGLRVSGYLTAEQLRALLRQVD